GPRQRGGTLDHAEVVRVDEEVLPEVAVRPHAEAPHPPQAGLPGARHRPQPQPKMRSAFASTVAPSAAGSRPRSSAMNASVWATKAGWLRSRRTGCGVRNGASVSTKRLSSGTARAASASSPALG